MNKIVCGFTPMNKACYKCGTDKELSKRGKTVMICKPCRREQYRAYKASKDLKEGKHTFNKPKPVRKHVCSSCGSDKDVSSNELRNYRFKWKCEKCINKINTNFLVPTYGIDPEWRELAMNTARRISARFR